MALAQAGYVWRMSDERPDLSPEAIAQLTTGPNRFALAWVRAVSEGDVASAWEALSDEVQLALAQMWIYHNPAVLEDPLADGLDRDQLAERLLAEEDQLSVNMRFIEIRTIYTSWGDVEPDKLAMGTNPRPIGPGLEVVRLLHTDDLEVDDKGIHQFQPGTWARSLTVIVASDAQGWRVAGVNDQLIRPGWPPTTEQVVGTTD